MVLEMDLNSIPYIGDGIFWYCDPSHQILRHKATHFTQEPISALYPL